MKGSGGTLTPAETRMCRKDSLFERKGEILDKRGEGCPVGDQHDPKECWGMVPERVSFPSSLCVRWNPIVI